MNVGVVGLGKMGLAVAVRLQTAGFHVVGYDLSTAAREQSSEHAITCVGSVAELAQAVDVIWLMLPAGDPVEQVLQALQPHMHKQHIIVDGGNSNYKDSVRRAQMLKQQGIAFIDCGTSGGLQGSRDGFCLMIGGETTTYNTLIPLFKAIAQHNGYALVGPHGAGHYVKAIHNGIEYGLLQAYTEGLQVLKEGSYKEVPLDLAQISNLWMHGSIIRSYLLQLTTDVLQHDQNLSSYSGYVAEGGTGLWAMQDADEHHIEMPVLKASLHVRQQSRISGGNFATKLIASIRHAFGGHAVKKSTSM